LAFNALFPIVLVGICIVVFTLFLAIRVFYLISVFIKVILTALITEIFLAKLHCTTFSKEFLLAVSKSIIEITIFKTELIILFIK